MMGRFEMDMILEAIDRGLEEPQRAEAHPRSVHEDAISDETDARTARQLATSVQ